MKNNSIIRKILASIFLTVFFSFRISQFNLKIAILLCEIRYENIKYDWRINSIVIEY